MVIAGVGGKFMVCGLGESGGGDGARDDVYDGDRRGIGYGDS